MADWTTIPNSSIETGKPIRAIDGRALRDNPIAIAEGAVGAPRIQPPSMAQPLVSAATLTAFNSTNWLAFTGLGEVKDIRVDFRITGPASGGAASDFDVAFSNDAGSTWGSTQTLIPAATLTATSAVVGLIRLDMETGEITGVATRTAMGTNVVTIQIPISSTLTVPADCNAIRFRVSAASSRSLGVSIMSLGARA